MLSLQNELSAATGKIVRAIWPRQVSPSRNLPLHPAESDGLFLSAGFPRHLLAVTNHSARSPSGNKLLQAAHDFADGKVGNSVAPNNFEGGNMSEIERGAPFAHATIRHKILPFCIAGLLGATALVAASVAHARTTQITILNRGIAFGGFSFPVVGQYEFITGVATGEVNPSNPQNAVITDLALAPRNTNGNVVYSHNFYILKPLDLSHGNHKMMYEPPNRGNKTYQMLKNTPTGTNDPAALTDPTVLGDSFLWTRGYTTVWTGWENNLGPLSGLTATAILPVATNQGATITGPGYEYIV